MADSKLSALTAETAPAGDDLIYLVKDAGGDRKVTVDDLAASSPFTGGGGTSPLLALTHYNPSTVVNYSITATPADIDATNLAVTFTVPASGTVLIKARIATVSGANGICLLLREASSNLAGSEQTVTDQQGGVVVPANYVHVISGLTPAASKTYKLAAVGNTSITNAVRVGGRGTAGICGSAVIEVWAGP